MLTGVHLHAHLHQMWQHSLQRANTIQYCCSASQLLQLAANRFGALMVHGLHGPLPGWLVLDALLTCICDLLQFIDTGWGPPATTCTHAWLQVAQLQAEKARLEEAKVGQERTESVGLARQVRDCRARIAQQDRLLDASQ